MGWKKYAGFVAELIVSVLIITVLNSIYIYEGILGLIFILNLFLYSLIFLQGEVYTKLFISGFINCMVYFISLFTILCMSVLFKNNQSILYDMTTVSCERIILIVVSKILLIASCLLLLRFKFNNILKKQNMIALIIMPIVVELSMVGIAQIFIKNGELNYDLLLISASVMLANILTYYVFIKINNDLDRETEFNALQQKYEYDAALTRYRRIVFKNLRITS